MFVPLFALTVRSFIAKSYSSKINNNEHTMTSVSIAFRWAMLCTKSELRFRQYSFNHRIRNLRSVEVLRLTPYPLYQHAIVPFEFPLQVGWLFPLFTFNNVPLRGRYTFALSSALSLAYCRCSAALSCPLPLPPCPQGTVPYPAGIRSALTRYFHNPLPALAALTYPVSECPHSL